MKLLIAGGGTGGHIYPALAVAEWFLDKAVDNKIVFVASREGMEKDIIPDFLGAKKYQSVRYQIKYINVVRALRKLTFKTVFSPCFALMALLQSTLIILKFKPQAVLITGGFVGLPVALAAYFLRVPVVLQEQNVTLGFTNKICSFFAKVVLLSFEESKRYYKNKKARVVGNPVRKTIFTAKPDQSLIKLGLDPQKTRVLIWGGSQGARAINKVVVEIVKEGIPKNLILMHVVGKRDFKQVLSELGETLHGSVLANRQKLLQFKAMPNYYCVDYLDDVSEVLAACDLVIGRAGATAIAEALTQGKPLILIPFPYAAEDHQTINAKVLQDRGIAVLLKESNLSSQKLRLLIDDIIKRGKLANMKKKAVVAAKAASASRIIDVIYAMARK